MSITSVGGRPLGAVTRGCPDLLINDGSGRYRPAPPPADPPLGG